MTQATITNVKQININEVESVARRNGEFLVRTIQTITNESKIAHRVYTGNTGMNGKMSISRTFKVLAPKTTVRQEVGEYPLTAEAAKMIITMMEEKQLSKLDKDNWAMFNMSVVA